METTTENKYGLCECIYEPRGDFGLEGYQLGDKYVFKMLKDKSNKLAYKIFHAGIDGYGEYCRERQFRRFFKITKMFLI